MDNMEKYFIDCPQCGDSVDRLHEGNCKACCDQNQEELDRHNLSFDRWQGMSDGQRENEIQRAIAK